MLKLLETFLEREEKIMGKAHESNKQARKQPAMTAKEKKAAKRMKKHPPGNQYLTGHH
jgi:hypothetical protein